MNLDFGPLDRPAMCDGLVPWETGDWRLETVGNDGAVFSQDRNYRYVLWRFWPGFGNPLPLVVVGLNPSTADHQRDDPTIRRCAGYARAWGFGGLLMLNLFALRSPNPKALYSHADPVGAVNDACLEWYTRSERAGLILAAWGAHGRLYDRGSRVACTLTQLGVDWHCLGTTRDGEPTHPLYQPGHLRPSAFLA